MARTQVALRGYAVELARELASNPTKELVRRINTRYRDFVPRILGTLSVEQQARYGLSVNDYGRLMFSAAQTDSAKSPAAERIPLTPAEIAKALHRTRPRPELEISKELALQVYGYGKSVPPDTVVKRWNKDDATPKSRLDLLRRTIGITSGEVSSMPHNGEYARTNGGYDALLTHAENLVASLIQPAPHSQRIRWGSRKLDAAIQYTLVSRPLDEDNTQFAPVLIRTQDLYEAVELNAVLINPEEDGKQYASPGRIATITGSTIFALSSDLAKQFTDEAILEDDTEQVLDNEVVEMFLQDRDEQIIAPAYTSFMVEQHLLV